MASVGLVLGLGMTLVGLVLGLGMTLVGLVLNLYNLYGPYSLYGLYGSCGRNGLQAPESRLLQSGSCKQAPESRPLALEVLGAV